MAGIQLGGLASGLDTAGLISQLMSVERQPRGRIVRQQAAVQARQDALRDIATKLKGLRTASLDLQSASLWTPKQTLTTTDATRASASAVPGGTAIAAGTYDVEVQQLATTESETWNTRLRGFPTQLTFTDTGGTQYRVDIGTNASTDDIVAAVNSASMVPVVARNYNGQLLLEAKASGGGSAFSVTGAVLNGRTAQVAGVNAVFTVNGVSQTSTTNTSTTAIPGAELRLAGVTAAGLPVKIAVGEAALDKSAVLGKVKAFVEAYNAVVDATRAKLGEKRVPNAQTETDARKGVLFADSGLSGVLSSLRNGLMERVDVGNPETLDQLAEIGVSTGVANGAVQPNSVNGRLTFDESKFNAAWDDATTRPQVERLLRGSGSLGGYAQRLDAILKPMTDVGGLFDGRITASTSEMKRLTDGLTRMDLRLERKEDAYRRQFTALESALARMQSQGQDLAARLGTQNDS